MRSILIIRPSAIGDIVMASPMIRTLRAAYPKARLVWLAEPQVVELLRHHPDLDEVIVWPKNRWRQLLREGKLLSLRREVAGLRHELRRCRFDLALDAVGLLKSRLIAKLSGARERIGFVSREPGGFLMSKVIPRGPSSKAMSSEYRFMMEHLGLDPGEFRPSLVLAGEDEAAAARLRQARGLDRYAVLLPFTTRPQKHWFEERWADLARRVRERFDLVPLLLGGPADLAASRRIVQMSGTAIENLTGETTIAQTAALVRHSSLAIGVDTGLTHMGTAFRRPTIALFGATCPYLETPSPQTRVLYHPHPCSPCKRSPTCAGDFTCMQAITVDEVLQTAASLLAREGGRD